MTAVAVITVLAWVTAAVLAFRNWRRGHRDLQLVQQNLRVRPKRGNCLACGADETQWCSEGCPVMDPMDYR